MASPCGSMRRSPMKIAFSTQPGTRCVYFACILPLAIARGAGGRGPSSKLGFPPWQVGDDYTFFMDVTIFRATPGRGREASFTRRTSSPWYGWGIC